MIPVASNRFRVLADEIAGQITATIHDQTGAFIRTPLLYPSGATVIIRIEPIAERFFVSDIGSGYEEADTMGAGMAYARHAREVAEVSGVTFDSHAFFVLEVSESQLPGAVVTIANCSQEAVIVTAHRHAEKRTAEEGERLYERLITIFPKERVERAPEVIGASTTKWPVAALVRARGRPAIFEPVTHHHISVVNASAKFHDIALADNPPARIAVVRKKAVFGTLLGVLSQAANVIEESVPDSTIARLGEAA